MDSVLCVAKGLETTGLDLSSAEGFLLSRIDGATTWRLLRQIGGASAAQIDACLERWLARGWIEEQRPGMFSRVGAAASEWIDASALDPDLELPLEVQRRVLEFEAALDQPYASLLGVEPGADPKALKRAYFELSREFHPDRYFRREIGSFAARFDRIFKRILEAYEMLSDPVLSAAEDTPSVDPKKRPVTKLERLKQRMPFRIDHAAFAARRARAEEIFREALIAREAGRLPEAEKNLRIAITFDPARSELKDALGSVRIELAAGRVEELLARPLDGMDRSALAETLRALEDTLPYQPRHPGLNERAARICLRLGRLEIALEYAGVLLEQMPESSTAYALSGRIREGLGDRDQAIFDFERALEYDTANIEARRALTAARVEARDMARGGRS